MSLSYQEILALYECLVKSKKGGTNNFLLSDGEDWKKNPVRLVLKDSKYGGLVLVHMNCEKSLDIVEGDVPEGDNNLAFIHSRLGRSLGKILYFKK